MANKEIKVILTGDASGLKTQLSTATADLDKIAKSADSAGRTIAKKMSEAKSALESLNSASIGQRQTALTGMRGEVDKLTKALTEAKRERDFLIESAKTGGDEGMRMFGLDIANAKARVTELAAKIQAKKGSIAALESGLQGAGFQAEKMAERLQASLNKLDSFGKKAQNIGKQLEGAGLRIGAIGVAGQAGLSKLGLDMASLVGNAISAEKALYGIATTADLSGAKARAAVGEWTIAVNQIAKATNKSQTEVVTAFGDLVAKGLDPKVAIELLTPIGQAATAAGADIKDMASAANAAYQNMAVGADRALNIMAQAGKSGAFELRDMAQYFDLLTVKSALLGQKGTEGLASLAAAAQIARKGAGDASTAANNLANFLDKLTAPVTAKAFEKFGINLSDEIKKGIASGDLIGYMGDLVQRLTQGDAAKLSQLFTDVQAKNFIAPLLQNLEEYKRIRDESLGATGVVAQDFATAMQSASAQMDRFKISATAVANEGDGINQILSSLTNVADWVNQHPDLSKWLIFGTAGAAIGGAAVAGIGAMITAIGGLTAALSGLATFLVANPMAATVIGVAAVGVASFAFGTWLNDQISLAVQALTGQAGATLGTALYDLVQGFKELPAKINAAVSGWYNDFAAVGAQIVQGLNDGIKRKAAEVVDSVKSLGSGMLAGIKDRLGIRSPSREFMLIGEMAGEGLKIGILGKAADVHAAARQLGQAALYGAKDKATANWLKATLNDEAALIREINKDRNKMLAEGAALAESLRTPLENAMDDFERYDKLLDAGAISWDTYARAVAKTTENIATAGKAVDGVVAIAESPENKRTIERIEQTFHDGFVRLTNKGKSTWKAFSKSLATTFKSIVVDEIYNSFLKKPITIFAQVVSTGLGSLVSGAAGASSGSGVAGNAAGSMLGNLAGIGTVGSYAATGFMNTISGGAGLFANTSAGLSAAGGMLQAGNIAGGIGMGLGAVAPYLLAAVALYSVLKKDGNKWGGVYAAPSASEDAGLVGRIVQTHGKDALYKGASGLELGASWKRTDGETTNAALEAMKNVDAALYGITHADMTGKFQGNFYGYDKKHGGYLAGSADKVVGNMDEVLAAFTRDWVAAADTVEQINKDLVATITGSAEEVLTKTISIAAMTQADMDKLFGESITVDKFKDVAKAGEGAGDAFARLAPIFTSTGNLAKIVGADIEKMFGAAGLGGANAREKLVKNAGGSDALNTSVASYADAFYTDEEKRKLASDSLAGSFDKLGVAMPKTKEAFRAMMEDMANSGKLATDEGSRLYAELLKLAPAFASVTDAAKAAEKANLDAAIESAKAATDAAFAALERSIDAQRRSVQALRDAAQEAVNAIESIIGVLDTGIDTTRLGSSAAGKKFVDDALAAIQTSGYLPDQDMLSKAISAVTGSFDINNYASQFELGRDKAVFAGKLELLKTAAGGQLSVAKGQLSAADKQLLTLDQTLETARSQLDALRGIDTGIRGVEDALRALAAAMSVEAVATRPDAKPSGANGGESVYSPSGVMQGRDPLRDANIAGIAYNGGNITDASVSAAISAGLSYGYSPDQIAAAWNASHGGVKTATGTDIINFVKTNNIPGFADGGLHTGGLRLVGERGMELEATGPARIWTAEQTSSILAGAGNNHALIEEVKALRAEVSALRKQVETSNQHAKRTADAVNGSPDQPVLVQVLP